MRVSQAYFDVLAAQDTLTFVQAQKTAVAEQLASAKRNFEVGTVTITDTREAQARYDLVIAQEIAADNDLRVKRLALNQLVGKPDVTPYPLALPAIVPALLPADVNAWVQQGEDNSPAIQQARPRLEIAAAGNRQGQGRPQADARPDGQLQRHAQPERQRHRRRGHPQQHRHRRPRRSTCRCLPASPPRTGSTKPCPWKKRRRPTWKPRAAPSRRPCARAYFGVVSGQGQVKALEAAEASSQSALDANQLGYQVGVRINIDVLNSQSQLYQTKRDLAQARYDVLVGRPEAAAGQRHADARGPGAPAMRCWRSDECPVP